MGAEYRGEPIPTVRSEEVLLTNATSTDEIIQTAAEGVALGLGVMLRKVRMIPTHKTQRSQEQQKAGPSYAHLVGAAADFSRFVEMSFQHRAEWPRPGKVTVAKSRISWMEERSGFG